ncbi:hypothetical protein F5884DRAFT_901629 [Xylogone sp. PMI_703]|nr:hypothetical protein F5884DRAFT_901629 [Xylogone sp. PMI_703]
MNIKGLKPFNYNCSIYPYLCIPPPLTSHSKIDSDKRNNIFARVDAPESRAIPFDLVPSSLSKRDDDIGDEGWWKYLWDVGCNDIFDEILGAIDEEVGEIAELICDLKEFYDDVDEAYKNRDAIKCVLTECYINIPTSEYWDFTSSWTADFEVPPQPLASGPTGTVSCVDCSLSVTEVKFQGRVMVNLQNGKLEAAYMTPTVSWSSNLVMGLTATDAFSGTWNYQFPAASFPSPVIVPGEFTITPSMIYSLGLQWSTDSALDIVGGGKVSVNSGSLYIDFMEQTATPQNFIPEVQYTYPTFSTASKVSWNPIMRSALSISVDIFNAPYGAQPIYITSAASIGFNAALLSNNGQKCKAGQLEMTSYSNVANNVLFSGGKQLALGPSGQTSGATQCFNVPNDIPTADEVNSLRSVGAAFCTAYLNYKPPVTIAYAVSTLVTPTAITVTVPTTISTASTVYTSPTITQFPITTTTIPTISYVYTFGRQSLAAGFLERGLEITPGTTLSTVTRTTETRLPKVTSAPTLVADKRQAPEPTMISTWDADKIELACSQIATGTSTKTYYTSTSTLTSYSGTVTHTATSTIDVLGQIATSTLTQTVISATGATVTSGGPVTSTVASSCPLQTQASCFTLTGHGAPHIDGKKLYMSTNAGDPYSEAGVQPTKSIADIPPVVFLDGYEPDNLAGPTCSLDKVTKTMICDGGWFSYEPPAYYNDPNVFNTGPWQPMWYSDNLGPLTPIVLTYDEVTCPCAY